MGITVQLDVDFGPGILVNQSLYFTLALSLVLTIRPSFSSVTLLEGNPITLSCTPSIMEVALMWTHNGTEVMQRRDITFTPSVLNHNLIIGNAMESDSGVYVCSAVQEDITVEESITVNIVPGNCTGVCMCIRKDYLCQ